MFSHPTELQADLYTNVLTNAFSLFVPCKTFQIRPDDQPWANSYTRLLLRKKNRNYRFYKKYNSQYNFLLSQQNIDHEILTKYENKKNKAYSKARQSANQSTNANKRAKLAFFNSVNSTMTNYSISAKKKFNILQKLMTCKLMM